MKNHAILIIWLVLLVSSNACSAEDGKREAYIGEGFCIYTQRVKGVVTSNPHMDFVAHKVNFGGKDILVYEGNAPKPFREAGQLQSKNSGAWSYGVDGARTILRHRTQREWPAMIQISYPSQGGGAASSKTIVDDFFDRPEDAPDCKRH